MTKHLSLVTSGARTSLTCKMRHLGRVREEGDGGGYSEIATSHDVEVGDRVLGSKIAKGVNMYA